MKRRTILAGASLAAAATWLPGLRPGHAATAAVAPQALFFDADAPVLGNPQGDVQIAEFFDYQCSWCKRTHAETMQVVEQDGGVRLVKKDWPVFGPASVFAAQAVLGSARLGHYRRAMDTLMAQSGALTSESILSSLATAGLDIEALRGVVNAESDRIGNLLTRNWHQAEAFAFIGTPSFVIGRTAYPGVLDREALKRAIDRARG
ncbi:DsbA family protein [Pseudohoeflea coraliihabitans]|uniref:DsbA family protein n=1 Tax=Pseudohoeflea coraliihabitans TaxID=2860393 RepID=A0ABS6WJY4_9HYPH|nr:DsbA family protein [Pseudohoeflea sp. DP4N28-3]MBW3095958.1 DsbA family protein [Pseudohoeflea sp. DP4N28-3]